MPRNRTGSLDVLKDAKGRTYFRGRIRLADGSRQWVDPPDNITTRARAREWVAALQEREACNGILLAERKGAVVLQEGETVRGYVPRWIEDRKRRGNQSTDTEEGYLKKHVLPLIGDEPMATIGSRELEDVRDALDAKVRAGVFKWKTAQNIWGYVTSLFSDACEAKDRSLRVRSDNPTAGLRGVDKGDEPAKTFLYPDEFLRLVSCERVPLKWRRTFALAVYLYVRAAELSALEIGRGIDVDRAIAEVTEQVDRRTAKRRGTKTGITRRLPIEANLLPLLRAISDENGGAGRISEANPTDRKLWRQLRRCLLIAGVKRMALHERTATAKPITFHDLRATGITWCAVRGDDPLKIKQRAGHKTFSTTEKYIREAENIRDGFGEPFPPLPGTLLVRDENGMTESKRGRKWR